MEERFVVELIKEIGGKEVVSLMDLMGIKPVSEFKLAEKLKETVNQIRNRLYKLYSYNLVDFIRKKDKKKGWYIYYWMFDSRKAIDLALDFKTKKITQLKGQLEKEKGIEYFMCKADGSRLALEEAMEQNFRCPECDDILVRDDNVKKINEINREISKLEKESKEIRDILEVERLKELRKLENAKKRKKKVEKGIKKKVKKIKKKAKKKAKLKSQKKTKQKKK